jgi:CTP synthase (UTP-ammonia lyase)
MEMGKFESAVAITWRSMKSHRGFTSPQGVLTGVIEAIESEREDWIAIGTQFHPENEAASALDVRVFEEFLDLVREPVPQMLRLVA